MLEPEWWAAEVSSSLIGWMWLATQRIRAQLVLQLGHTLSAELDRGGRWFDFRADSSGQAPVDWLIPHAMPENSVQEE